MSSIYSPTADAANRLVENSQLLRDVNREIRTLSHLLHPPLLDEAGLASALDWYVAGFSERSKIQVDLKIQPDFTRLSNDKEIAIFRVIQESLTNIHRHSGSDSAQINIQQEDGQLVVKIADQGKGIPLEKQENLVTTGRSGVGLAGMRERLRELGGNLQVRSEGKGTLVIAKLPLSTRQAI